MLLRKRRRQPMRRTASMTKFAADAEAPGPADPAGADSQSRHAQLQKQERNQQREVDASDVAAEPWRFRGGLPGVEWVEAGYQSVGVASPGARGGAGRRRNTGDLKVVETAPFLTACSLCKRRLGPGRDTFMYRGDTAFCSLECRQLHINQVELKEICSLTSMKDTSQATNASEKPENGETTTAA